MFLVSTSSRLVLPVRAERKKYHPESGALLEIVPDITLQFVPTGDLPEWAREAVKGLVGFGIGIGKDIDPFSRCGVCDVDAVADEQGWDAATRAFVQARLESVAGSNFAIARPPAAVRPWEKYDEVDDIEQVLYTLELTGIDPSVALRYEHENANRSEFIRALEDRIKQQQEDVVGVIPA